MKPVLKQLRHEAKRGLFAVDSCQQLSNTVRAEFKIKNWLQEGFASFNVNTTLNQNNVSGFETKTNGYTLVNLGLGGTVKVGKQLLMST
jgi:hypothetical protein